MVLFMSVESSFKTCCFAKHRYGVFGPIRSYGWKPFSSPFRGSLWLRYARNIVQINLTTFSVYAFIWNGMINNPIFWHKSASTKTTMAIQMLKFHDRPLLWVYNLIVKFEDNWSKIEPSRDRNPISIHKFDDVMPENCAILPHIHCVPVL